MRESRHTSPTPHISSFSCMVASQTAMHHRRCLSEPAVAVAVAVPPPRSPPGRTTAGSAKACGLIVTLLVLLNVL